MTPPLDQVLAEHGVTVVPNHAPRPPRHTHARQTLEKILRERGVDHLRDVLTCVLESENNRMALVAPVILAVSDVLCAHPGWWQRDASAWLDVMDHVNLLEMFETAKRNRRAAVPRAAIATDLFHRLEAVFGPAREATLFDQEERP